MRISRLDLDAKGAGSPHGLVTQILKHEPDIAIPVPIEELCARLDITKIAPFETEGFEGSLLTDIDRSKGIILFNQNSHRSRRRFTIAHELGHFLIPTHMPSPDGQFLCSRADMLRLTAKENDRRSRMEVEANQFAALMLIPPPALKLVMKAYRDPNLQHIPQLELASEICTGR